MKNAIKKAVYGAASSALLLPVMALAQFDPPSGAATGLPESTIYGIVENIMYWLLGLVGIAGVIGFAISGIMYLTSAGDDDRMGTAKKAMIYSIIGVIVALVGLIALTAIRSMLGGSNTQF
ncbi:MAG: hypothetical protein UR69_C0004G0005 [Candidatus Moranbacteria bacterium GW2011_GWE2_35_2-]|nr:MAG: hypothetical protein UR69_C0004G0005 [Candidatus Moranbacteria bacterium GW2011_GWE2_35_2-]KKQ22179.1 MAG: hypothetical protein US37_C0003G0005 [Candidatus Moranbacteria bacterium GW2011_GWF2_37_11]KKQ28765.1 MAG: hypothetical protein US44_C0007G0051 [Candidatus Moranbacteria bacterium GW2011_GWD1_37_17]KKQ30329.1 MAG: hypothetical protein US47_C0003G0124 [Candidatus Moranbacteria bacterium GW2011_GWE1_37_24]KKQ46661.1 MAG: hypothetical protein US66_C0033G0006 [Candidatus Moranbacteria 